MSVRESFEQGARAVFGARMIDRIKAEQAADDGARQAELCAERATLQAAVRADGGKAVNVALAEERKAKEAAKVATAARMQAESGEATRSAQDGGRLAQIEAELRGLQSPRLTAAVRRFRDEGDRIMRDVTVVPFILGARATVTTNAETSADRLAAVHAALRRLEAAVYEPLGADAINELADRLWADLPVILQDEALGEIRIGGRRCAFLARYERDGRIEARRIENGDLVTTKRCATRDEAIAWASTQLEALRIDAERVADQHRLADRKANPRPRGMFVGGPPAAA